MPEDMVGVSSDTTVTASRPAEVGSAHQNAGAHQNALDERGIVGRGDDDRREVHIRRLIIVGDILCAVAIVLYVFFYTQTGIGQMLIDSLGSVLGLACLALAGRAVRRGKLDGAGYWSLLAAMVAFGSGELVWAGETLYMALGGVLLISVVGSIVLPRRLYAWLGAVGLYLVYILLVNWLEPLPRYDIVSESSGVVRFDLLSIILLAVLALVVSWRVVRSWQRIVTIRARLMIAFVVLVLVPVITLSLGAIVGGGQDDRDQAINQLEVVAAFKEFEINTWTQALRAELDAGLNSGQMRAHAPTLLRGEAPPQLRYTARYELRDYLKLMVRKEQYLDELFLMDLQGEIVVSTDSTHEGEIYPGVVDFDTESGGIYVHPPLYSPLPEKKVVVVVDPMVNTRGQLLGFVAGRTGLSRLSQIMLERAGLGETGEAYLVDADHIPVTTLRSGREEAPIRTEGSYTAIEGRTNGSGIYVGYEGKPVVGVYRWLPELQVAMLVEQGRAEALSSVYETLGVTGIMAAISLVLAVVASVFVTRNIASPMADLVEVATQVASGDLECVAAVGREDEIGLLARAFNSMTTQLRDLVGGLEQRVTERTRELEQRSAYLEASAEVGRAAASILDADQLIQQVVDLIQERFSLYYVGLFMVDEAGEWAVLRAGTGEAGRTMLARGHRIRVGKGMVGWSVAHARARVAMEAGEDVVRLATAELPDTRSEAALPLRSRGHVLGVLTVQSDRPDAFDEDTMIVLQTMADQVAVALDNARLFAESEAALEATRRAYGELSHGAWADLLRARPDLGVCDSERGIARAGDAWRPEMERALQEGKTVQGSAAHQNAVHRNAVHRNAGADRAHADSNPVHWNAGAGAEPEETAADGRLPLAVPIKVRGDVVGVLDTYKHAQAGEWMPEEIALLETLADQLGVALEGARLYQDAQRRAARERLTREITDKMRRATDVEGIVQTVVDELFGALGTSRAFVRLGVVPPTRDADQEPKA